MTDIHPLMAKRKHVYRTFFLASVFLLLLLSLYLTIYTVNQRHGKSLVQNDTQTLDLRAWDFASQGMNFLETGWQFYPNQLLNPTDFWDSTSGIPKDDPPSDASLLPHYNNVTITTDGWRDMGASVESSDPSLPPDMQTYGYGTYRIIVQLPLSIKYVGIDFPEINHAAQIWINGKLQKNIGLVTPSIEGYRYEAAFTSLQGIPNTEGVLDIVVSCANYTSTYGGITCSPAIGTTTQIDNLNLASKMWITSVFTMLILVVVTGFYVSFTFENKKQYYFYILIISMSLAYEYSDKAFNPLEGDWNRLLQTTFYLGITLLATMYFASFVSKDQQDIFYRFNHWDLYAIFFAVFLLLLFLWLNPSFLYNTVLIAVYSAFIFAVNLYNLIRVGFATLRYPEYGTFHAVSAVAALVVFPTMQVRSQQIYFIPLHSIGIVLMILGTAIFFTIRYVGAYNQISRFTIELEQAVQDKTRNIAKVNAELLISNQKLVKNEEARKKMMSNVSHDLRTPITAIRGYIELLQKTGNDITPETLETYLKNMHTRSIRMEQLIDDLMQLTRLESDGGDLVTQPVSLSLMIESLYELYHAECENTTKSIKMDLPANDTLMVMGDPNHLIRVIENLIVNAMRYTEDDGRIVIKAFREAAILGGENIHLVIKDNGCGIPATEITYVFDRFYRASNAAVHKNGSGLGLAIAKSIVVKHGGKIWVESWEKKGSNFHVLLPAIEKP